MPGSTHRPRFAAGRKTEWMLGKLESICARDRWYDAVPEYPQDVPFFRWKLKFASRRLRPCNCQEEESPRRVKTVLPRETGSPASQIGPGCVNTNAVTLGNGAAACTVPPTELPTPALEIILTDEAMTLEAKAAELEAQLAARNA